ncbi:hypothetical protein BO94DRAFT_551970 [Aspergillus sclerotioniger CBS 115572]|uniref:Uncharacterized protein n=1 Tax=Aspergillus sclerotioniger CBS 115572 TaxID=1450535 RepID=A0A317XCF7_9EURO|nr:hypothetical protein BO94DRAFT_551970 [Aspergillus sclerotioniger CBS 115572]PWY96286.1 hypothetical protein BO94DRAFT_551970 [Aspergillus sclerotioniger CBS 115572]
MGHPFLPTGQDASVDTHDVGPLLGRLLQTTGYPIPEQYQYLPFARHHIISSLGPYPQRRPIMMTYTDLPIVMSINFQDNRGSTVRVGIEPICELGGTSVDQFNQVVTVARISALGPECGCSIGSCTIILWEILGSEAETTKLNNLGPIPCSRSADSLGRLDGMVRQVVEHIGGGGFNELCRAAKSQAKIHGMHGGLRLEEAESAWTLGGKLKDPATMYLWGLELVRRLWGLAYYEIRRGCDMPVPKLYFPLFGRNNMFVAKTLAQFFQSLGWTEQARTYVDSVQYLL